MSSDIGDIKVVNILISKTSEKDLFKGVLDIIKYTDKQWDPEKIQLKLFTEGYTNTLVGCFQNHNPEDLVLVRVYGERTELFIDRRSEIRNMITLHKHGLSPPIYCAFTNGFCYGFLPGITLDKDMVMDRIIAKKIAEFMGRMHSIPVITSSVPRPSLFKTIRKLLSLLPSSYTNSERDERLKERKFSKDAILREIDEIEDHFSQLDSAVVFCHNDALPKNIIFNPKTGDVSFIDYEYADFNYQAFDIANHFSEFAGIDPYEPKRFPDREFQMFWLKAYLNSWQKHNGRTNDETTDEETLEKLFVHANKFAVISNMLWGIWALVQAEVSSLKLDYIGYGLDRIEEYFLRKKDVVKV